MEHCTVLIETLWNVKVQRHAIRNPGTGVLIETLWNVKTFKRTCLYRLSQSFNRNIVECKGGIADGREYPSVVLIETLWNVKEHKDGS